MGQGDEFRRRAAECEREARTARSLVQRRQFRLLARAWRDLAEVADRRRPLEPRSFQPHRIDNLH